MSGEGVRLRVALHQPRLQLGNLLRVLRVSLQQVLQLLLGGDSVAGGVGRRSERGAPRERQMMMLL